MQIVPGRPNENDPARDLRGMRGVTPYRHLRELQQSDPVCANCWHLSMPRSPLTPSKDALDNYPTTLNLVDDDGAHHDLRSLLTDYYAGLGYCTLYPPHTTPGGLPIYPTTHVSNRCSSFTHIAEAVRAMTRAADGQPRDR